MKKLVTNGEVDMNFSKLIKKKFRNNGSYSNWKKKTMKRFVSIFVVAATFRKSSHAGSDTPVSQSPRGIIPLAVSFSDLKLK